MEVFHVLFVDFGFVLHRSSLFDSQFSEGKFELFAFIDLRILPFEHPILHHLRERLQHMCLSAFVSVYSPVHRQQIPHDHIGLEANVFCRLLVTELDVPWPVLSLEKFST